MKDYLIRALAREKRVRVCVAVTKELVEVARKRHDLWPIATAALGRTMTAGLLYSSDQKTDEDITIKIDGKGPLGNIVVCVNNSGEVRGFLSNPHVDIESPTPGKLAVGAGVGINGNLCVIKNNFTGEIPLVSGEIAEDFAHYFVLSEQIPTVISLGVLVETDCSVLESGGILIQLLPDATEEDIDFITERINSLDHVSTLYKNGHTPESILDLLFDDGVIIEKHELSFKCKCSFEKVCAAIKLLGDEEIKSMMLEEDVNVHCDYCSEDYKLGKEELSGLLTTQSEPNEII